MTYGRLPAVTRDGSRSVAITANIELVDEIESPRVTGPRGSDFSEPSICFWDGLICLPKRSNLRSIDRSCTRTLRIR